MARYLLILWPVQAAKEKLVRSFAAILSQYQLFAMTGCRSWAEVMFMLIVDWVVFVFKIGLLFSEDQFDIRRERRLAAQRVLPGRSRREHGATAPYRSSESGHRKPKPLASKPKPLDRASELSSRVSRAAVMTAVAVAETAVAVADPVVSV